MITQWLIKGKFWMLMFLAFGVGLCRLACLNIRPIHLNHMECVLQTDIGLGTVWCNTSGFEIPLL